MISGTEYLVIAVAIFLVFGPRRLPELSRKAGALIRELRTYTAGLREAIESEAAEVTEPLREVSDEARRLADEGRRAFEWRGPVHDAGPTPEEALGDLERIERGEDLRHHPEAADRASEEAPEEDDGAA